MANQRWIEFINQQPLTATADESQTLLTPLLSQRLIGLEGPDSISYLQGQLTADLAKLSSEQSLLAANCTPKGMVISVLRLIQLEPQSLLLRLSSAIEEPALANLKKFSVFSKLSWNDVADDWCGLGLCGDAAESLLQQAGFNAPQALNHQSRNDGIVLIKVGPQRFELWCPADQAEALWLQLAEGSQAAPESCWQAAEIEAGLVQLDADSIDSYIPQMLNLQAVDAVSFDKGCYTGQEVVARLQFRGKLKKLLFGARTDASRVETGTALFNSQGRNVGKVLHCAELERGTLLQAVISKKGADEGDLRLGSVDGEAVKLLSLPYEIEPELFERPER
ncbi:folate-binding protein [Motiliproteus coralliicola]|uniref:Folate-binding protein n=1 Tax=Motiliproteus coralliicola TaxID=2283196 RepID=A0A369WD25_9GAMM|nr:folate-binding protein YgfZ [Motiliproteus coralliicola]RDE19642.1 folate-binding protein [Motiliproteus coralliicola]